VFNHSRLFRRPLCCHPCVFGAPLRFFFLRPPHPPDDTSVRLMRRHSCCSSRRTEPRANTPLKNTKLFCFSHFLVHLCRSLFSASTPHTAWPRASLHLHVWSTLPALLTLSSLYTFSLPLFLTQHRSRFFFRCQPPSSSRTPKTFRPIPLGDLA